MCRRAEFITFSLRPIRCLEKIHGKDGKYNGRTEKQLGPLLQVVAQPVVGTAEASCRVGRKRSCIRVIVWWDEELLCRSGRDMLGSKIVVGADDEVTALNC